MFLRSFRTWLALFALASMAPISAANAALVTNPDDPRNSQGATVGTFAELYYGSNTLANRQLVVDNQLLDDSIFASAGYQSAQLVSTPWALSGPSTGRSLDLAGTGSYDYVQPGGTAFQAANGIDDLWVQTSGVVGESVWDLGFQANKAAVFNTIDHGPLPGEAIESTIYLSNDLVNWVQAVVERVWLEGFQPNLGIQWDGFAYAVGTGTDATFRYATIIHGGPAAIVRDGDNEINGIMGLTPSFQPTPEPSTLVSLAVGLAGSTPAMIRRRREKTED